MEDLLFENRDQIFDAADPEPIFESFAQSLGLDLEQFRADFNDPTIENLITIDEMSANALGVSATPRFFLNGQLIDNPTTYDDFRALVQAEIDAVQSAPAPMVSVSMVDAQTARVTVDPESGFVGTINVRVGVRDNQHGDDGPSHRFQDMTVTVSGEDPFQPLPAVTQGEYDDPGLLGQQTDLQSGAISADAIFPHVTGPIDYPAEGVLSNPPTYGPHHASNTAPLAPLQPTGVYTTVQDDADLVHNLEHGHVWISYDPSLLSSADISELERLVNAFGSSVGVVLTPRPANDTAIVLASWGRLLTLDTFDAATIREFAETNRGHAPEGFETP